MELLFIFCAFFLSALVGLLTRRRIVIEFFSVASSFVACFDSVLIALKVSADGTYTTLNFFFIDSLGAIVLLILGFIGFITTLYSVQYLRQETAKNIIGLTRVKQYFILLNLFLLAMFSAITAGSPIFAWISIEATTLSTAFLISFYNKSSSVEAAWKYLIINSVGLLLGFFGTLLYFTSVGVYAVGQPFVSWQVLLDNVANFNPLIAKVAFIFVFIGYGTKAGFAPMHTWLPDAHSKAPAPISALLSGTLLSVALVIILRFRIITNASIGQSFTQNILIIFGLLSIVIGALTILNQKNYKRLIAYSSIENMGVMVLGFGFGGSGVFFAILHMIYNALIKSALFLMAGTIFLKYSSTKIAKVKGVLTALPITGILFLVGFFAIMGIPPFGVFFTKVFILLEGMQAYPFISMTALCFMTILFVGFLKHTAAMIFGEKPIDIREGKENIWLVITPLALLLVVLYLSFSIPPFLVTLINSAVLKY